MPLSQPECLLLALLLMGGLAKPARKRSRPSGLPPGAAVAGVLVADRVLVHRMRAIALALLMPFYFIRAGSFECS